MILQGPPPPPGEGPGGGGTGIDDVSIDQYTGLAIVIAVSVGIYYFIKQKKLSKVKK